MKQIKDYLKTLTPWGFPLIYLGWAYLFWVPVVLSGDSVWSFPNVVLFLLGGFSPLLAGLFLSWIHDGREGLKDLGRKLVDFGRIGLRWWIPILLFWPVFNLIMARVALPLGITSAPLELISADRLSSPLGLVSLVLFSFLFPAVEEVGLRGYWLGQLQERWSALTSGLINGTTWAVWHAPFVLFAGYYANTTFDPQLSWWLPTIVLNTLFLVWIYNNTHRSILAVLLFHGFGNLTGEIIGFTPEMYPFIVSGYLVAAVLIVAIWSPGTLKGWE